MASRGTVLLAGLLAGVTAGVLWSQSRQSRHRAALFSGSRASRRAALGWLSGDGSAETVRLLREYVRWEPESRLRRRGRAVLQRLEADLGVGSA
jgi:predicted component of type VI protein secretion system